MNQPQTNWFCSRCGFNNLIECNACKQCQYVNPFPPQPQESKGLARFSSKTILIFVAGFIGVCGLCGFLGLISNQSSSNSAVNKGISTPSPAAAQQGEFVIKSPLDNQVAFNLPMMLQLTQNEIEKKLGKPVETEREGDKEERMYAGKTNLGQLKVAFGYFRKKPLYGRLYLSSHLLNSLESIKQAGADIGNTQPKDTSIYIDYWYRGEFDRQLYDISVIRDQSKKIDCVFIEIYIPEEIIVKAEQVIARGEQGELGKLDVGRAKDKLKTIKDGDKNYNRAQQLIKKIEDIWTRLS